ncbi:MAG: alpha/beta hydrolase [Vulcanimicrobiaceae bacterium]
MTTRQDFLVASAAALAAAALPQMAAAQPAKANILLVHGAFSDASAWRNVIPLLQAAGHRVVGVQMPLTALADDIATTKLQLAKLSGPTVVVGHSYGGAVITGAARDVANVKSLVYLTALAPSEGESANDLFANYPSAVFKDFVPSGPQGFVVVNPAKFAGDFAADVDPVEAAVLAATQKPTSGAAFATKSGPPAWNQVPSFYAVCTLDRAIDPALQRFVAKRMKATSVDIAASHFAMISHPKEVAALIARAAG